MFLAGESIDGETVARRVFGLGDRGQESFSVESPWPKGSLDRAIFLDRSLSAFLA